MNFFNTIGSYRYYLESYASLDIGKMFFDFCSISPLAGVSQCGWIKAGCYGGCGAECYCEEDGQSGESMDLCWWGVESRDGLAGMCGGDGVWGSGAVGGLGVEGVGGKKMNLFKLLFKWRM